jgi:hypothetical protein
LRNVEASRRTLYHGLVPRRVSRLNKQHAGQDQYQNKHILRRPPAMFFFFGSTTLTLGVDEERGYYRNLCVKGRFSNSMGKTVHQFIDYESKLGSGRQDKIQQA